MDPYSSLQIVSQNTNTIVNILQSKGMWGALERKENEIDREKPREKQTNLPN